MITIYLILMMWRKLFKEKSQKMYILSHYVYANICNVKFYWKYNVFYSGILFVVGKLFAEFPVIDRRCLGIILENNFTEEIKLIFFYFNSRWPVNQLALWHFTLRHYPFDDTCPSDYILFRHLLFQDTSPSATLALATLARPILALSWHFHFRDTCPGHLPFLDTSPSPTSTSDTFPSRTLLFRVSTTLALPRHLPIRGTFPSRTLTLRRHLTFRHLPFRDTFPSAILALPTYALPSIRLLVHLILEILGCTSKYRQRSETH